MEVAEVEGAGEAARLWLGFEDRDTRSLTEQIERGGKAGYAGAKNRDVSSGEQSWHEVARLFRGRN
jgi:hypothetical protein